MIIRFVCWFGGHKTVAKAYTGRILEANGREHKLYKWEKQSYCLRCGKGNT